MTHASLRNIRQTVFADKENLQTELKIDETQVIHNFVKHARYKIFPNAQLAKWENTKLLKKVSPGLQAACKFLVQPERRRRRC